MRNRFYHGDEQSGTSQYLGQAIEFPSVWTWRVTDPFRPSTNRTLYFNRVSVLLKLRTGSREARRMPCDSGFPEASDLRDLTLLAAEKVSMLHRQVYS